MPRKKDLKTIEFKDKKDFSIKLEEIKVKPKFIYYADVVKSGNSSSIKAPLEFLGNRALVIILDEK